MNNRIHYLLIAFLLFACAFPVKAQYKAKLNSNNMVCYRASSVYMGFKGSAGSGILDNPSLQDEKMFLQASWDCGAYIEWRFLDKFSVGLDALYSHRGFQLAFNTPYLISYDQTAITNITYKMRLQGLEASMPLTYYFGKPQDWLESYTRMFVFAAPVAFLPIGGSISWKRTHLIDNQEIASNDFLLNSSSFAKYEYGAKVGFGVVLKQRMGHYFFTARADIAYYHGLSNTFSESEMSHEASFYGLGDIEHEILGTRYLRQLKVSFSFAIPFRNKPQGACRDFGIY